MIGHDTSRLGELAAASGTAKERLSHGPVEGLQVLRRRRLADAAGLGGGGDRSVAPDLDEKPEPEGIEDLRMPFWKVTDAGSALAES